MVAIRERLTLPVAQKITFIEIPKTARGLKMIPHKYTVVGLVSAGIDNHTQAGSTKR